MSSATTTVEAPWRVVDDVFDPEFVRELARRHRRLRFHRTDPVTPYDSHLVPGRRGVHFGSEVFFDVEWHQRVAGMLGVELAEPGRTDVMLRRHRPNANGIWVHSDRTVTQPVRAVALIYLNHRWSPDDGGLLHFWADAGPADPDAPLRRWFDHVGVQLQFLDADAIDIEVADERGVRSARHLRKVGEIVPKFGRVVFVDCASTPAYHSVTPSGPRARYNITQRLY